MTNEYPPLKQVDYAGEDAEYLKQWLSDLDVPANRIVFPHVRLKGLANHEDIRTEDYRSLTKLLLDVIEDEFVPQTVLVPTFTYSFTNSGVYHRTFSQSEVGRFSEEVRRDADVYRTPDPVFNVVDTGEYLSTLTDIDYTEAFGPDSLYAHLDEQDAIILNIDLNRPIISTQLHYIERINDVPYRYDKEFEGVMYETPESFQEIEYTYFVRDLDRDPQWDREHIRTYLSDHDGLSIETKEGLDATAISAQTKRELITKQLREQPEFLLQERLND